MLQYGIYINKVFKKNITDSNLTFIAPNLPEGVFSGNVSITVRPVNRFGEGPADNATAEISKP